MTASPFLSPLDAITFPVFLGSYIFFNISNIIIINTIINTRINISINTISNTSDTIINTAILDMLISDLKNGGETAGILLEYFSDEEVISLLCHFGVIVCNSTLNRLSDHHDRPSVMLTPTHPKSQLLLQCSSLTK